MEIQINKRLLLPFIILLAAFNVLPIGLLSFKNIDLIKIASLVIFFISVLNFKGFFSRDIRYFTFFFIAILFSVVNMFTRGKYMDWTFFYCLNYLNLYLLLLSFRNTSDIKEYINLIIFLCAVAFIVHMLFYLFPFVLEGKLNEIRMGSINLDAINTGSNKIRIFIPGMGFIALFLSYYIIKLIYYRRLRVFEYILLGSFFVSIFILASVRTYLLCVFVALVILLLLRKLSIKRISLLLGVFVVLLSLMALVSTNTYDFLVSRFDIFWKLGSFQFKDVINLDVDYDSELTFGTIYFRIMEVIYVLQNFSNDTKSILFGNIGILYDFLGVEQEPAPHVSIFGIYYLFGIVGLTSFIAMLIYYTKMILQNLKKYKGSSLEFLNIVLTIFWFSLFAISFFGGIYYSELILVVTFIIASSIYLKNNYSLLRHEN